MNFADFKSALMLKGLEFFGRYYSIYRGTVADNEDPDQLGRLKVIVPGILPEASAWAWPRGLPAGAGFGFFAIPAKKDVVWVSFEGGDTQYPVWEGGWWKRGDVPAAARRKTPNNYVFQTPKGQILELDDENNVIRITHRSGLVWEVNENGISSGSKTKSHYRSVLGEKLLEILKEFLTEVTKITVVNGAGTTSIPKNFEKFLSIIEKLENFLSDKNTLE